MLIYLVPCMQCSGTLLQALKGATLADAISAAAAIVLQTTESTVVEPTE
jgi:hypothetical protein